MFHSKTFMLFRKMRGQHFFLLFALFPALALLSSCGGSSTAAPTPTISVYGSATSVNVNGTVQFTATVLNLSSTLVSWQVNSVNNGNSTYGTINANGLYTAPSSQPSNNVVTITAIAQAQTTLTATATLSILPPATITGITPADATVASGASQAFTATVSGGGNIAVYWYVNGNPACSTSSYQGSTLGGNATIGTITNPGGNYTAPVIPPPGGVVTIYAVSEADATQFLCVPVHLTLGNGSLNGSYAFSTRGRLTASNAFFARVGSFTAGGNGIISGGTEDTNQEGSPTSTVRQQRTFTGSYAIGPDGRGTMQFCEDVSTTCTASLATAFFQIVVSSPQQAQIIEFSPPTSSTSTIVSRGEMDQQDPTVFGNRNFNLFGTYSFDFSGVSSAAAPESAVGEFTANGNGVISAGGPTTPGSMDINPGGTQALSASTYSISANGRGTMTIGSLTFSFYLVSASHAKFIETDASPSSILVGDAVKQQASANCAWGLSTLNGPFVFETSGTSSSGGIGDLVSFTADGSGGITSGAIDENNGGSVPTPTNSLNGTYTLAACGRGTLAISGHSYVLYMVSPASSVIQEITSGVVADGTMVQPQGGPFTTASLSGSYALNQTGVNAAGTAGKRIDLVGQLTANGTGNVTSGNIDVNNYGATSTVTPQVGTYTTVTANGRSTMLLNPTRNFVLYVVSPTQAYVLDTDTTGFAMGSLYKQF
ncbi:MAG TPA: hypothetical protein VNI36_12370 [Candidatus Dormibacteraeota bacterium]|nr:hypothetical protein [Candidatus Dormibacteraeota bacterium]